jgi:N-acetylneuraminic acid mutarotase
MQKEILSHFIFVILRRLAILLFCGVACSMLTATLLGFRSSGSPSKSSIRMLTFAERVEYQRAIEDVYWRHRIWPKENPDPKPPLNGVMSQTQLEKKVEDYLRDSQVLEDYWQRPLTAEQLQAEMDRMAQHTRQPEVLNELFEALGNDPFVIAECLARPVLSERLVADLSAQDKTKLSHSTRTKELSRMSMAATSASAAYTLPKVREGDSPCTDDTWTPTSLTNVPSTRAGHTAVWTGTEMIVWSGIIDLNYTNTGGKYNPSTDSWTATNTTSAPTGRDARAAVWTGSEMIIWGGFDGTNSLNTGGKYNPGTDSWTVTSTTNGPAARNSNTAVWTGSEMIVWGGGDAVYFNTGGRYNPSTDSWTTTSTTNAPAARVDHTAVWTGSEMIVWGGSAAFPTFFNTGGKYNPSTDSWTATSTTNVPAARDRHTAVLAGNEMIVWGGSDGTHRLNTGGRYDFGTDSWVATSTVNAPTARYSHTAVGTGSEMIVWGGTNDVSPFNTGGRYEPGADTWTATSTTNAANARYAHTAVWTGSEMIVWGGVDINGNRLNTGSRYCAQSGAPFTLSAAGRKVQGINTVRLTWSGATSTNIDVYRNSGLVVTTANDGSYTDSTGDTGRARYIYKVCEAGTNSCSNTARVTFRQ